MGNIAVDDANVPLEESIARHGAEVHHRYICDQFRGMKLEFFQQRAGGPEKADENNPSSVAAGSAEGVRVIGRMVEIAETVLFQPRDKRADEAVGFRHPESGDERKERE